VHAKVSGTDNWGKVDRFLARLREARANGVKIDCDEYPYTAASNPLRNLVPSWLAEGGIDKMLTRLGQREVRAKIKEEIAAQGLNNFGRIKSWDAVRIAISPDLPRYAGKTIVEIAREQSKDPFDAALDYIVADRGQTRVVVESIAEDDVRDFIRAARRG
jgi:N-acyl-D-aspartate/D-glutamate deacylase